MDWRRIPSLTSLRAFEAVARTSGFSVAARELNVTHAAISQQVRGLEAELGVPLVIRSGRGMELTVQGEALAAALSEGFGTIEAAIMTLAAHDKDRPVRVTATAAFTSEWLMPRLRDFWKAHPDIAISLHPDPRPVDLRRDGMDLGVRYGRGNWPAVQAQLLTSARMVVAADPSLVPEPGPLSLERLQSLPWVLMSDWPEQRAWLESIGLDLSRLHVTVVLTEELAMTAARQGLGLVVQDRALVDQDIASGRLTLVHDRADTLPAYFLVTAPGPLRRPAQIFYDWLVSQV